MIPPAVHRADVISGVPCAYNTCVCHGVQPLASLPRHMVSDGPELITMRSWLAHVFCVDSCLLRAEMHSAHTDTHSWQVLKSAPSRYVVPRRRVGRDSGSPEPSLLLSCFLCQSTAHTNGGQRCSRDISSLNRGYR